MIQTRKQISIVLTVCMLISMLPMVAFAETETPDETIPGSAVEPYALLGAAATGTAISVNSQADWDALIGNTNVIKTGYTIQINTDVKGGLSLLSAVNTLTIDGVSGNTIDGKIHINSTISLTLKDLNVCPSGNGMDAVAMWGGGTLTTQGTVMLTGSDWADAIAGHGVFSNDYLTITASDDTSITGGSGMGAGRGVRLQNGSLTLNGGSPSLKGGNGASGLGAEIQNGSMTITSGSPKFMGGGTSEGYGNIGAHINNDLIISSDGSPEFIGSDGIGSNPSANGANVSRNLEISAGTPLFKGGSASGGEWNSLAGDGVSVVGTATIRGSASPVFIGGDAVKSGYGGCGAFMNDDIIISTDGSAVFEAGKNGDYGLNVNYGSSKLDLSTFTGIFTATGNIKAFAADTTYPAGLPEARKYNGTAKGYRLNMSSGADVTPPAVSDSSIIIDDVTADSLTLKWTKATDEETAQAQLKYYVFQSESGNISTLDGCMNNQAALVTTSGIADTDTCHISGLLPNKTYYFNVVVADEEGNMRAYTMASHSTADAPVMTYSVTVTNGTANPDRAQENSIVTITAEGAPAGQRFKTWTVQSGNITLVNPGAATTTFTMPASDVAVTAAYENKPDRDNNDNGGSAGSAKPAEPSVPAAPEPPKSENKPVGEILKDAGSHWAADSIQFVYDRGIMTGTSAEEFSPEARMNRGMLITALGRLAKINALDYTSGSFNDVDASSYYAPYAEWSLISNITRGTGGNNFSPDNPVTREELAVILVNFAKAMGYALPSGEGAQSFADDSTISPWASEAIGIMRNANIMNGDTNNNFNPEAPATRAEIAAVLQRFIELMGI